jgi:hypothetical protein
LVVIIQPDWIVSALRSHRHAIFEIKSVSQRVCGMQADGLSGPTGDVIGLSCDHVFEIAPNHFAKSSRGMKIAVEKNLGS